MALVSQIYSVKALMCYQDTIGAASSIFVFGIGALLLNSLLTMPLYFLIISLLMVSCTKYITNKIIAR
ncbi:hypothetical protein [Candidatus Tisiphia endosymbiont of Nemotelus uliginosus]|uniref:hypothetical protein n=1 Tax=Candidatus Tisiphia endosymbiont of Nemotelus uliginosus TaxID=3077926 RepID=UPI0035C8C500